MLLHLSQVTLYWSHSFTSIFVKFFNNKTSYISEFEHIKFVEITLHLKYTFSIITIQIRVKHMHDAIMQMYLMLAKMETQIWNIDDNRVV